MAATKGHSHDHHDHSNCNHDHGHGHSNGAVAKEQLDKVNAKQQETDKLAKTLIELNTLANDFKKKMSITKPSPAVIAKADIDLLVTEMGLTKGEAESALKNHEGDVIATLNDLIAQ
ncbi:hypothetical protein K501DRAFT_334488 [Backusella circina FSU 941]|nr:hypothetical protein K501DRAFT_334488 [Backusella circina FSU 941]